MTTEERLANLERELGRAKRRSRWLLVGLALGLVVLAGEARASIIPYRPITELVEFRTVNPWGTFYTQLEAGPYMLKLSVTQFNDARSMGLLSNDGTANNINTKYPEFTTYVPDGQPHIYWLCMEDDSVHGGGDLDFKDAMTRVTDNRDGTVTLECISGVTGYMNSLMDKLTGLVLFNTGSNQWDFSPARTVCLVVPEPTTLGLVNLGLAGLMLRRRRGESTAQRNGRASPVA